jgi:hypothetical protein
VKGHVVANVDVLRPPSGGDLRRSPGGKAAVPTAEEVAAFAAGGKAR